MSIIVHRCQECGHIADWHDRTGSRCSHGCCPCTHPTSAVTTDPEIMPTYNHAGPVATLHEPGSRWGPITLCGCDACHELWRERDTAAT